MKRKAKIVFPLFGLFLFLSCSREELPFAYQYRAQPFHYTDVRLTPVVATIYAIETYEPFMNEFCRTYGTPLWDEADIYQRMEGEAIYFWIPLYKDDTFGEIQTVWFFELHNNMVTYGPVSRNSEFVRKYGQEGQFDYLSYRVFGKENTARVVFRENPETRVYDVIGMECRDSYVVTEYDGVEYAEYNGTICKLIQVWKDYMEFVLVDNDNGEGGGGGFGVPVVGSDLKSIAPKASSLFEHPAMITQNWKVLEKMLDKITQDCMGGMLYSKLKSILNGNKIGISFRNGEEAGFNYANHQLSLPMGRVESNVLLHELFHALQYHVQQDSAFKKSYLNNEIEAHYAQYAYLKRLPEYKGSKWEEEMRYSKRGMGMTYLDKQLSKYTSDLDPVLDTFIKCTLKSIFLVEKEYENYAFDESKEGIKNLSLFKELSKNCN